MHLHDNVSPRGFLQYLRSDLGIFPMNATRRYLFKVVDGMKDSSYSDVISLARHLTFVFSLVP